MALTLRTGWIIPVKIDTPPDRSPVNAMRSWFGAPISI